MKLKSEKNNAYDLAKLRWACRRGMLELDVLLGNFLNEAFADLKAADKACFIRLLETPDPTLFAWLLGSEAPPDASLAAITEKIRSHARSRI